MVRMHKEKLKSVIEGTIIDGTIIDIETIGNFTNYGDSRRFINIIPVTFGYIDSESLQIHCSKKVDSLEKLKEIIADELGSLDRPFYAFNSDFERGTFFHSLNKEVPFERELNKERFEPKRRAIAELRIPQYGDPFNDNGRLCSEAWKRGQIEAVVAHNRACLLKERDILLKRGFRTPDPLSLIRV